MKTISGNIKKENRGIITDEPGANVTQPEAYLETIYKEEMIKEYQKGHMRQILEVVLSGAYEGRSEGRVPYLFRFLLKAGGIPPSFVITGYYLENKMNLNLYSSSITGKRLHITSAADLCVWFHTLQRFNNAIEREMFQITAINRQRIEWILPLRWVTGSTKAHT